MHGPRLLAHTLSKCTRLDEEFGNAWQYQPRSDHHSKVPCWGVLFDLLLTSRLLRDHFREGRVAFGINHVMRDFKTTREKNLDLVICTPGTPAGARRASPDFRDLAEEWEIELDNEAKALLDGLPAIKNAPVGEVHLALEAKACMTAHRKARPRLYDELSSSHQTIHGSAVNAIAAAFVMVNAADEFISPGRNRHRLAEHPAMITKHRQPDDTIAVLDKIRELPRRASTQETGFDALACVVVKCRNDGKSPFTIESQPPAVDPGNVLHYDNMIRRAAKLYESRFPQA